MALVIICTVSVIAALYGCVKLIDYFGDDDPSPVIEEIKEAPTTTEPVKEPIKEEVDLEKITNPDAEKPFAKLSTFEPSEKPFVVEEAKRKSTPRKEVESTVQNVEVKVSLKKKKKKPVAKKNSPESKFPDKA